MRTRNAGPLQRWLRRQPSYQRGTWWRAGQFCLVLRDAERTWLVSACAMAKGNPRVAAEASMLAYLAVDAACRLLPLSRRSEAWMTARARLATSWERMAKRLP